MSQPPPREGDILREGTRLTALRTGLLNPRFVLEGLGALLVKTSQRAFKEERMGGVRWKNREETKMVPNWPAILAWFTDRDTDPPKRMQERGNTLQGTGALLGSLAWRVIDQATVEAGSRLPYAGVLHAGGESRTVPITGTVQTRLGAWIARLIGTRTTQRKLKVGVLKTTTTKEDRATKSWRTAVAKHGQGSEKAQAAFKRMAKAQQQAGTAGRLGWLLDPSLTGRTLPVRHPARPIVGIPKELVAEILTLYGRRVRTA